MKNLSAGVCVLCVLTLLAAGAEAFEIRFSPKVFALSSKTDSLTINTSVAYYGVHFVWLTIGDKQVERKVISPDSSEQLVVRCSKDALKEAVGKFDSLYTERKVMITIDCDGIVDSSFKILRIKK
jgi:hypothetical protein